MLLPEQTTFRRIQTDAPGAVTMYFSIDATDAIGRTIEGPWEGITLDLSQEEATFAAGMVARFRQAFCDRVNQTQEPQP